MKACDFFSISITDLILAVSGLVFSYLAYRHSKRQNKLISEANSTSNEALAEARKANVIQEESLKIQRDLAVVRFRAYSRCDREYEETEEGVLLNEEATLVVTIVNDGPELEIRLVALVAEGWNRLGYNPDPLKSPLRMVSRSRREFKFFGDTKAYANHQRFTNHVELCSEADGILIETSCGRVQKIEDVGFRDFSAFMKRLHAGEVRKSSLANRPPRCRTRTAYIGGPPDS